MPLSVLRVDIIRTYIHDMRDVTFVCGGIDFVSLGPRWCPAVFQRRAWSWLLSIHPQLVPCPDVPDRHVGCIQQLTAWVPFKHKIIATELLLVYNDSIFVTMLLFSLTFAVDQFQRSRKFSPATPRRQRQPAPPTNRNGVRRETCLARSAHHEYPIILGLHSQYIQ